MQSRYLYAVTIRVEGLCRYFSLLLTCDSLQEQLDGSVVTLFEATILLFLVLSETIISIQHYKVKA